MCVLSRQLCARVRGEKLHFSFLCPVWLQLLSTHIRKAFHGCLPAHTRLSGTPAGQISHDTKHLAHQPQIILIKTNIWPFPCDFTPLLPGIWCCALFHIPCSPAPSSRYTPFDLSGEKKKVFRGGEKAQITEEILLSY